MHGFGELITLFPATGVNEKALFLCHDEQAPPVKGDIPDLLSLMGRRQRSAVRVPADQSVLRGGDDTLMMG